MITALIVSNIILWICVLLMAVIAFAVVRQVGVLFERISPVGALMIDKGPAVGTVAPVFELEDIHANAVKVGGVEKNGKHTLVFFLAPGCPICKKLLPILPGVLRTEGSDTRLIFASDGEAEEHRKFYNKNKLDPYPYLLSQELGMAYQIGKLPYAILLDMNGLIRAKGLVNTREQIESLFAAKERGVASLQEYVENSSAA